MLTGLGHTTGTVMQKYKHLLQKLCQHNTGVPHSRAKMVSVRVLQQMQRVPAFTRERFRGVK